MKKIFWQISAVVCVLLLILAAAACANGGKDDETTEPDPAETTLGEFTASEEPTNYVEMSVKGHGKMIIALYPDIAPITVENFKSLVAEGFYDGLTFHRIYKEFMIQGGDPEGTGSGGSGKTIKGEFSANGVENNLSHTRGVISMARRSGDMDSATSQFFIVHSDKYTSSLDGQYAAFGKLVSGYDVLDSIASVEVTANAGGEMSSPVEKVEIEYVRFVSYSGGDIGPEIIDGTTAEETTYPRLDYFTEDMSQYITMSKEDYESFNVEVSKLYIVDDEAVEKYLMTARIAYATAREDATDVTDLAIELGDKIKFYYQGFIDGETNEKMTYLPEEGRDPATLIIGSQNFIPGFEDALIGIVPDQTSLENMQEINVTFPINYGDNAANGKDAVFKVYVVSTTKQDIPEADETFIKETMKYEPKKESYADGELLIEFKEHLREMLTDYYEDNKASDIEDQIWKTLRGKVTVISLPQIEIDYYYNTYIENITGEYEYTTAMYQSSYGYSPYDSLDDFALDYMGLDEGTDWKADLLDTCRDLTLENVIYHRIAEIEGVETLTEEEIDAELETYLEQYGSYGYTKESLREAMGESYLKESALYTKILKFLQGRAIEAYK